MTLSASRRIEWIRDAIDAHQGRLIRFAMRFTGNLETARDVVQDTFLKLCREDPDRVDHLPAWLFRVCRNRALDIKRKEGPLQRLDDATSDALPDPREALDEGLGRDEDQRRVLAELRELPATTREVLRLRFQEELSYKEISSVTGHSVSHVGVLIHHGIRQLRERLRVGAPARDGSSDRRTS